MPDQLNEILKIQNEVAEHTFGELLKHYKSVVTTINRTCVVTFAYQDDRRKLLAGLQLISKICSEAEEMIGNLEELNGT